MRALTVPQALERLGAPIHQQAPLRRQIAARIDQLNCLLRRVTLTATERQLVRACVSRLYLERARRCPTVETLAIVTTDRLVAQHLEQQSV